MEFIHHLSDDEMDQSVEDHTEKVERIDRPDVADMLQVKMSYNVMHLFSQESAGINYYL